MPTLTEIVGLPVLPAGATNLKLKVIFDPPYQGGPSIGLSPAEADAVRSADGSRWVFEAAQATPFALPMARKDIVSPAPDGTLRAIVTYTLSGIQRRTEPKVFRPMAGDGGALDLSVNQNPGGVTTTASIQSLLDQATAQQTDAAVALDLVAFATGLIPPAILELQRQGRETSESVRNAALVLNAQVFASAAERVSAQGVPPGSVAYQVDEDSYWQLSPGGWVSLGIRGASLSGRTTGVGFSTLNAAAGRTSWANGKVSYMSFNEQSTGWPTPLGTVVTDRTYNNAVGSFAQWDRQTVYDYFTDAVWQRRGSSDTAWTDFVLIAGGPPPATVRLPLNRFDGTWGHLAFPANAVSYMAFSNSQVFGYPPGVSAGELITHRIVGDLAQLGNEPWDWQELVVFGSPRRYTRYALTASAWSSWSRADTGYSVAPTNSYDGTAPRTAFTSGAITSFAFDSGHNAGMPCGAGTVRVDRSAGDSAQGGNASWDYQTVREFGSLREWSRFAVSETAWSDWRLIGETGTTAGAAASFVVAPLDSIRTDAGRSAYAVDKVTVMAFSSGNAGNGTAGALPAGITGGNLTTHREAGGAASGSNSPWDYQELRPFGGLDLYRRYAVSDTAWTGWSKDLRTPENGSFTGPLSAGPVPALSKSTIVLNLPSAQIVDTILATRGERLPAGLIVSSAFCVSAGVVNIDVTNLTGGAINDYSISWTVRVIR